MKHTKLKRFPNYGITETGKINSIKRRIKDNLGRTRTLNRVRRKTSTRKDGYVIISLRKDNKYFTEYLHRLMAETFLEVEAGKNYVNHKDGNKSNNHISNLEYCTRSFNMLHAYSIGLLPTRRIEQLNKQGTVLKIWRSMKEAEQELKIHNSNITSVCKGRRITAGGFKWRFKQ
jgi:hypothetical protein